MKNIDSEITAYDIIELSHRSIYKEGERIMHALIRKGNGEYYVSAVFGYFRRLPKDDSYEEYIRCNRYPYYIIWNEEKTGLIKKHQWVQNTKYIIPQVLIVDGDQSGWIFDKHTGSEWMAFLPKVLADELVEKKILPHDIREQCLTVDEQFTYQEYRELKTQKDIDDLEWVSGGFHDAYVKQTELLDDGSLYVWMDGVWGCSIELWFWGDVEYEISPREGNNSDPYWMDSSVFFENGFVYLVDDCEMTANKITPNSCWFKGRYMKYHVIPN